MKNLLKIVVGIGVAPFVAIGFAGSFLIAAIKVGGEYAETFAEWMQKK